MKGKHIVYTPFYRRDTMNLKPLLHWCGGDTYAYGDEPPHYPVPSVIGEISFHPEFVTLWSVDMEQPKQTWWKRYAWE